MAIRTFLLSAEFQAAMQLMVGAFVASLFVFVGPMAFKGSCLAMTLFIIMSLVVPAHCHVGTKLLTSCVMLGSTAVGSALAGAVASVVKACTFSPYGPQPDTASYTALLMVLASAGLALLCINWVAAGPPFLHGIGIQSCLIFGIVIISAQNAAPSDQEDPILWMWEEVVGYTILSTAVAAGCCVASSLLVLPTCAVHELRWKLVDVLVHVGQDVSSYSSEIFDPINGLWHDHPSANQLISQVVESGAGAGAGVGAAAEVGVGAAVGTGAAAGAAAAGVGIGSGAAAAGVGAVAGGQAMGAPRLKGSGRVDNSVPGAGVGVESPTKSRVKAAGNIGRAEGAASARSEVCGRDGVVEKVATDSVEGSEDEHEFDYLGREMNVQMFIRMIRQATAPVDNVKSGGGWHRGHTSRKVLSRFTNSLSSFSTSKPVKHTHSQADKALPKDSPSTIPSSLHARPPSSTGIVHLPPYSHATRGLPPSSKGAAKLPQNNPDTSQAEQHTHDTRSSRNVSYDIRQAAARHCTGLETGGQKETPLKAPGSPFALNLCHQLLNQARDLIPFATIEPFFMTGYHFRPADWGKVVVATKKLLTSVANLQTIMEEKEKMRGNRSIECYMGRNFLPIFRLAYAQISLTCIALSDALSDDVRPRGFWQRLQRQYIQPFGRGSAANNNNSNNNNSNSKSQTKPMPDTKARGGWDIGSGEGGNSHGQLPFRRGSVAGKSRPKFTPNAQAGGGRDTDNEEGGGRDGQPLKSTPNSQAGGGWDIGSGEGGDSHGQHRKSGACGGDVPACSCSAAGDACPGAGTGAGVGVGVGAGGGAGGGGGGVDILACSFSWGSVKKSLSVRLQQGLHDYWHRARQGHPQKAKVDLMDTQSLRALMFTLTLSHGICDAMEELGSAVEAALRRNEPRCEACKTAPARAEAASPEGAEVVIQLALTPPDKRGPGGAVQGVDGVEQLGKRNAEGAGQKGAAVGAVATQTKDTVDTPTTKNASAGPPEDAVVTPTTKNATAGPPEDAVVTSTNKSSFISSSVRFFDSASWPYPGRWLVTSASLLLGVPALLGILNELFVEVPRVLQSEAGVKGLLRSRKFQAGVKYFCSLNVVLMLVVGLSSKDDRVGEDVRRYLPVNAYVACAIATSQRVEATWSGVIQWLVGSALGGTLGMLCMLHNGLATNPYALMALICAFTFLVGTQAKEAHKKVVALTLLSFTAVILCQYKLDCDESGDSCSGSMAFYATRVLSILIGIIVAFVVGNLVLPWYTSDWALEVMGSAFEDSVDVALVSFGKFIRGGAAALEACIVKGGGGAQAMFPDVGRGQAMSSDTGQSQAMFSDTGRGQAKQPPSPFDAAAADGDAVQVGAGGSATAHGCSGGGGGRGGVVAMNGGGGGGGGRGDGVAMNGGAGGDGVGSGGEGGRGDGVAMNCGASGGGGDGSAGSGGGGGGIAGAGSVDGGGSGGSGSDASAMNGGGSAGGGGNVCCGRGRGSAYAAIGSDCSAGFVVAAAADDDIAINGDGSARVRPVAATNTDDDSACGGTALEASTADGTPHSHNGQRGRNPHPETSLNGSPLAAAFERMSRASYGRISEKLFAFCASKDTSVSRGGSLRRSLEKTSSIPLFPSFHETLKNRGVALLEPSPELEDLQFKVAASLTRVQASLAMDSTFWKKGVMATPPILYQLLQQEFNLLDRLSTLLLTLQGPLVTGDFTGWSFRGIVQPLQADHAAVLHSTATMANIVAAILRGDLTAETNMRLTESVRVLEQHRVTVYSHHQKIRKEFIIKACRATADQLKYMIHPDDTVRVYSFFFSISKFVDKATQIAQMVETMSAPKTLPR